MSYNYYSKLACVEEKEYNWVAAAELWLVAAACSKKEDIKWAQYRYNFCSQRSGLSKMRMNSEALIKSILWEEPNALNRRDSCSGILEKRARIGRWDIKIIRVKDGKYKSVMFNSLGAVITLNIVPTKDVSVACKEAISAALLYLTKSLQQS